MNFLALLAASKTYNVGDWLPVNFFQITTRTFFCEFRKTWHTWYVCQCQYGKTVEQIFKIL